jgi:hypothetical protein
MQCRLRNAERNVKKERTMRMRFFRAFAIAVVATLALPAISQDTGTRIPRTLIPSTRHQTPYTAELKITRVQTLADGTKVTRETTETRAVDAQGRLAVATVSMPQAGQEITTYRIVDPVAGTSTTWNSTVQQVTVTAVPKAQGNSACLPRQPASPPANPSSAAQRQIVSEDLGIQVIQGVEAHGRKTTITVPAGMEGNNAPLVTVNESWMATAIGPSTLQVRAVYDDPLSGSTTRELTNLNLGEPDAVLFQAPQGYQVVTRETQTTCAAAGAAAPSSQPQPE